MDIQLKKGLLETLVLAKLQKEDMYGYKLSEEINSIVDIAETALYPVLRRLKIQGFLKTYSEEHNGRLRKYYRITDKGRSHLEDRVQELIELNRIIEKIIEGEK